jgi:hypothetical protein
MRYLTLFILFIFFTACGSSESEQVELSYKSTFIMFNARNVQNDMHIEIELNNTSDYNKSIRYSKEDSHELWWYEDDNITVKYRQDDELSSSMPIINKSKGKHLICSVGNAQNTTLPLIIPPIDSKEMREHQAYIKVINAINDGIEKRVYINYESAHSDFTMFAQSSEKFYIDAATNSLLYVQYKDGSTFSFHDSINFDAKSAYIIVLYEDKESPSEPQIAVIDMTP